MQNWLELPPKVRWKLFRQFLSPEQLMSDPVCQVAGFNCDDLKLNWRCEAVSRDSTAEKLLLQSRLRDQSQAVQIEAVTLFPPRHHGASKTPRATACISSQPGCGVGCPFCATGSLGYRGDLTASEIAEQVYWTGKLAAARGRRLRNVVYMGMGEPLHNLEQVLASLDWLTHPQLFGFPQRRITVSTVGVPAAMLQLAQRYREVKIALSLHSADPEQRRQLVPKAVADLELLRRTIRQLNQLQHETTWLEVVMLSGVNDSQNHAQLLVKFCQELRVEVNLIPYNSTTGIFKASTKADREAFAHVLRAAGIRTTIRNSFGGESASACGQLHAASNQRSWM